MGTITSKRNSAASYCNGNGRVISENGGISLMHHPRSLSPLPHQRSKISPSELQLLQPGDEVLWSPSQYNSSTYNLFPVLHLLLSQSISLMKLKLFIYAYIHTLINTYCNIFRISTKKLSIRLFHTFRLMFIYMQFKNFTSILQKCCLCIKTCHYLH